jgi:hypothetical protein
MRLLFIKVVPKYLTEIQKESLVVKQQFFTSVALHTHIYVLEFLKQHKFISVSATVRGPQIRKEYVRIKEKFKLLHVVNQP